MHSIILLCQLFLTVFCDLKTQTIRISQGLVRGYEDPEEGIFVYYNVPYATTPKGPNKFQAPLPAPIWNGTFDAVDRRIVCPQSDLLGILPKDKVIHEDCLVANIYVPDTNKTNLPVTVYFHGGGFVVGWGDLFTFKKFVKNQEVIVVTFNYRLSAHGFLCLGTKTAPGNAGMKDQVEMLRWVKNNINSFGGNRDDVTIHGCSAGSTSVDLFIYSKMAKGLFKRVVADSGVGLLSSTFQIDPIESAKKFAKLLGYDGKDDIHSLESFYKTVPYEKLNSIQVFDSQDFNLYMSPCIETDIGEEMFMEDSLINILKNGSFTKTPILYGFTDMEGSFRLPKFSQFKNEMNSNFSNFLPRDLLFKDYREKEIVANKVKNFYFGDKAIGEETILSYVDFFTDVFVAYGVIRSVRLLLEGGHDQIYFYEYSYADNATDYVPFTNVRGATHCSQTFAVMDGFYNFVSVPYDEKLVSNDMLTMKGTMRQIWGNFMKTGYPISEGSDLPQWTPLNCRSEFMSINKTIQVKKCLSSQRALLWDEIYEKYYQEPRPPRINQTSNLFSIGSFNGASGWNVSPLIIVLIVFRLL